MIISIDYIEKLFQDFLSFWIADVWSDLCCSSSDISLCVKCECQSCTSVLPEIFFLKTLQNITTVSETVFSKRKENFIHYSFYFITMLVNTWKDNTGNHSVNLQLYHMDSEPCRFVKISYTFCNYVPFVCYIWISFFVRGTYKNVNFNTQRSKINM